MRKNIALVLALVMILSLIPMASFAQTGSATYTRLTSVAGGEKGNVNVETGTGAQAQNFGTTRVEVKVPANAITAPGGERVFVTIPRGVQVNGITATYTAPTGMAGTTIAAQVYAAGGYVAAPATLNGRTEVSFLVQDNNAEQKIVVELANIYVGANAQGTELNFEFGGQPGTAFAGSTLIPSGNIGVGDVTVSILDVNIITDSEGANQAIGTIRINETQAGAQEDPVRIKLPRGFYWDDSVTPAPTVRFGDGQLSAATYDQPINGRPTRVSFSRVAASTTATSWEVTGLRIVVDPTMASHGDVEASISNATPSTLIVARYGDYLAEVSAESKPLRLAGKTHQRLGDFMIEELIGDTLVNNRTITMTLPAGTKWADILPNTIDGPSIVRSKSENFGGIDITGWEVVDIAGRTLRGRVAGSSSQNSPAKLYFEAPRVAITPEFRGDEIVVTFGGSAGVGGEVVLASVAKPMAAELTGAEADLRIGIQNQAVSDIKLTEVKTEALAREGVIEITPVWGDVRFAKTPTAKVLSGDIIIEEIWTSANRGTINIRITADSDKEVGEILVSDLEVSLDRTAPEGALEFEFGGSALVDALISATNGYFPGASASTTLVVGNVITAAPGELVDEATAAVSFTVGSTSYTVDGAMQMMDVAPFISNDRLMVPVRYLEAVFGVQPVWNGAARTVTVLYEGKVFEMAIGSNVLRVNGAPYMELDATVEIVNERTFVPASRFARAMGIDYSWDATTQTATFK
ncbi:copper amine oxidase N-terminal domain-containing protein [Anoxynatronum buryatiense]|uniref:Copper amine oxidase N-terminal domain-containing protein n=1 Tax=Anoxynatronum buryatiense TaxID=489973 RepID=A0AA46AJ21_9CLOT|nr:copper amine oxidase N-terminal domain-containing protein [Anoxynatronum buryatiense]SMP56628.1 Copper amine oxidase N-terminal domain-containing protein [Anoxynatronum buryatiense]